MCSLFCLKAKNEDNKMCSLFCLKAKNEEKLQKIFCLIILGQKPFLPFLKNKILNEF